MAKYLANSDDITIEEVTGTDSIQFQTKYSMDDLKNSIDNICKNEYSSSQVNAYSTEYINDLNTYSTTEQRIGTWIDGKTIYRKVYTGTANSTNNTIDTTANISNLNFISINGWIKKSATVQQLIGMYVNADNSSGVFVDNSGLKLLMPAIWASSSTTYIVIVEYTKITD